MALVDLRLLNALQQQNLLTPEQINSVKLEVAKTNKNDETILLEKGLVREEDLYKTKAGLYNIPFIDLTNLTPPAALLSQVSINQIKQQRVIPFEEGPNEIKIVMADPFDVNAIQSWKMRFAPKNVIVHAAAPSKVQEFIDTRLGTEAITGEVEEALSKVEDDGAQIKQLAIDMQDSLEGANLSGAPIAKIVNSILIYATKFGASDVHIEPQEKTVRVRYRIDGVMKEKLTLPKQVQSAVTARIKIMSDLRIDETRLPQDGRIFVTVGDRKFDLRVSTLPAVYGEKVVMRLLERSFGVPPIEQSGLRGIALKRFLDATKYSNGIILVTGPTGSGKTQTLAGTLQILNQPSVNIITAEDPVEIRVPGVNQVQVNADIGLTFSSVLRAMLRQDPNIIMVGEIRDQETAQLATRAALTGHLVVSTVHTNSAVAALPRLVDMGVEAYLLASTIRAIVGQRLVRTICMSCRESYTVDDTILAQITGALGGIQGFDIVKYVETLSKRQPPQAEKTSVQYAQAPPVEAPVVENGHTHVKLYKGKGCPVCNNTGYKGRTGIFEVLTMSDTMADLLMKGRPSEELQAQAIKEGMITMTQDGYLKVLEGITTIEEVMRVANV